MPRTTVDPTAAVPADRWRDFFAAALAGVPVLAILRGMDPDTAVARATQAWESGVELVEVTLERPDGAHSLAAVVEAAGGRRRVGAGTVTTPQRLRAAAAAGAGFAVAPGLDTDTVEAAAEHGIPFLPGVSTPTEVGLARRLGLTVLKAFPASVLTPGWIPALRGPFPDVAYVATGGITADNAAQFLDAGALGVGVGSALQEPGLQDLLRRYDDRRT
jgi:2-dehydro-3-deoxyphosphogluconate aldolase / (4S)-4-hydroxy-2-oxoglutarate aldolase